MWDLENGRNVRWPVANDTRVVFVVPPSRGTERNNPCILRLNARAFTDGCKTVQGGRGTSETPGLPSQAQSSPGHPKTIYRNPSAHPMPVLVQYPVESCGRSVYYSECRSTLNFVRSQTVK